MTVTHDPIQAPPVASPATHDRRTVLRGFAVVGVAGAGGLLAGCGGDETVDEAVGDATSAAGEALDEATEAAESAAEEVTGGGESIAKAADVPVGGGLIVGKVVLTQPTAGDFKAFSSTCTHQNCTVASVADNVITCTCHGSQYSAEDGAVISPPAPSPLPEVAITVSGEDVMLA